MSGVIERVPELMEFGIIPRVRGGWWRGHRSAWRDDAGWQNGRLGSEDLTIV